jgi:hypothetical protein
MQVELTLFTFVETYFLLSYDVINRLSKQFHIKQSFHAQFSDIIMVAGTEDIACQGCINVRAYKTVDR